MERWVLELQWQSQSQCDVHPFITHLKLATCEIYLNTIVLTNRSIGVLIKARSFK